MFKKSIGRKFVAVLLMAALVAATGCGGKSTDTSNTGKSSTDSNKSDKGSAATTTISVYRDCFNLGAPDTAEVQKVQDAINEYIKDKGVQIELHDIANSEYKDKANLALGNGEIDLLWTANWIETIRTDDLVKQNAVTDLTSKLPGTDLYKALPEWVWKSSAFNGKNYFIPCYKESAEGYDLMFRKDLKDKFKWDLTKVKSLKDIEPMLKDCKDAGLKYPYLSQKTAMFFRYYLNKFDFFSQDSFIAVDKDQDKVVNTIATPEYSEFASLMGDWAAKGYLSEDDLTKTTTDTTTQTKDWGVSWWTDVPNNSEANGRYKQDVEMVKLTDNWKQSNTTLGSCFTISSTASDEKVDAAIKFLGLLYTDQKLANLYTFGIEGTDYTMENGKVKKIDAKLYDHSAWESTSVNILSLETKEPDNKVELYKTFNDNAKDSKADGFRFNKAKVDAKYAACQQVFNEFGFSLENGGYKSDKVADAIKKYQTALDDAGYQDVLKEASAQYEEWKKVR